MGQLGPACPAPDQSLQPGGGGPRSVQPGFRAHPWGVVVAGSPGMKRLLVNHVLESWNKRKTEQFPKGWEMAVTTREFLQAERCQE